MTVNMVGILAEKRRWEWQIFMVAVTVVAVILVFQTVSSTVLSNEAEASNLIQTSAATQPETFSEVVKTQIIEGYRGDSAAFIDDVNEFFQNHNVLSVEYDSYQGKHYAFVKYKEAMG